MSKVKFILKAIVSIIILGIVIKYIGIDKLYQTIIGLNLWYMSLLLITLPLQFLLATYTLKLLVNSIGINIGLLKTFRYFIRSYSLGLFAPAKLGEISFIYFLNKDGIELGKASAIFVLDKIITLITLSMVGSLGIFILLKGEQRIVILAFLGIIIPLVIFVTLSNLGREIIKRYILRKYALHFTGFSKTLFYLIKEKPYILLLNFFLALSRWCVGALSVYIIFLAFNHNPGFFYVWLILPLTIIISLVPITIAGLGIKEGTAVLLFNTINVPPSVSASVYFTFTAINYIIAGFVCIYYLYKK